MRGISTTSAGSAFGAAGIAFSEGCGPCWSSSASRHARQEHSGIETPVCGQSAMGPSGVANGRRFDFQAKRAQTSPARGRKKGRGTENHPFTGARPGLG